jgi:two-component system response regulator HydG
MPRTPSLLVVDDEPFARQLTHRMLEPEGWTVRDAASPAEASVALAKEEPDVVLLDVLLGRENGLDFLEAYRAGGGTAPVVVMTSLGEVEAAVRAMKAGAYDFLVKPVPFERLLTTLRNAAENRRLKESNRRLSERLRRESLPGVLVGESASMKALFAELVRVVDSDVSVCLVGETGTGKELAARWLHEHGPRAEAPYVALDTASLAPSLVDTELFGHEKGAFTGADERRRGKLEQADGGTLFLDELGGMPASTQARLLRVLQERTFTRVGGADRVPIDVRIVSAAQRPLGEAVREGRFREDLFFRLVVYPIRLPPLRERKDDLPLLVHHFIRRFRSETKRPVETITPEALVRLAAYDWPGNVRELENAVQRAVLSTRGPFLTTAEFPDVDPLEAPRFGPRPYPAETPPADFPAPGAAPEPRVPRTAALVTLEDHERAAIGKALAATGGNIKLAAERLEMPRSTLYRRIKALGVRLVT